jgi:hypothetical protein
MLIQIGSGGMLLIGLFNFFVCADACVCMSYQIVHQRRTFKDTRDLLEFRLIYTCPTVQICEHDQITV